jgi:7-cyano-7-deazaguanine synthase
MSQENGPAVVLVSGGLDSSVLLRHAIRNLGRQPVHALSFNYGQRHSKELECARVQAEQVGIAVYRVIDISFMGGLLMAGSVLVRGGAPVPDLTDLDKKDLSQPPTYVPNRNMMLLSMAAAYAEAQGILDVFYGAQAQDEYGYWDCTEAFLDRFNHVLALNRRDRVTVHAPFVRMKKSEIVRLGLGLGVDFALTWSCYRGGAKACGTCPTCVERLNAFRQAGAPDPLPYEAGDWRP